MRRAAPWLAALALVAFTAAAQPPAMSPRQMGEDFDTLWRAIDERYAYFDRDRAAWKQARQAWRPRATRATSRAAFIASLEGLLEHLGDDHVALSEASPGAARRLPMEGDIWARWQGGDAVVEAVRTFSDADVAGVRPGQVVTRIQGVDLQRAVAERLRGRPATASTRDRALRQLLAGPRQGAFRLEVRGGKRPVEIQHLASGYGNAQALIARRIGDERDLGYVRLRNGTDPRSIERFEAALGSLKDTRGLILDLRESTGPGSRAATEAILSRFVTAPRPWQVREPRGAPRITDTIAPRGGSSYGAPLVVLVDRWTMGEAEALAAGLQAAARATLVGTATAGLRGDLGETLLPHSGLVVRYPAQRTLLPDGTPREALKPQVAVDLAAPSGGPGDPILYQALKLLERH